MSASRQVEPAGESLKETFEAIAMAFILAFVFRAYIVEAFVIPTGSMAPTLYGEHLNIVCPECGYRFAADNQKGASSGPVACPMCHFPVATPATRASSHGDRILVHKYIYSFSEPRRWDVVVFKNPREPEVNYIKRLVGLPAEQLVIIEGNVFVRPLSLDGDAWRIARKTQRDDGRPFAKVQRAVWQPIYSSQYVPLDGGVGAARTVAGRTFAWRRPWTPDANAAQWDFTDQRRYRYQSDTRGSLAFDMHTALAGGPELFPYNQLGGGMTLFFEDVRVAARFEADQPGLGVTLQTTARLDSAPPGREHLPVDPVILRGRIDADGNAVIERQLADTDATGEQRFATLASGKTSPFKPGTPRQVEFWYVDQEASLWVDGKRICVWRLDVGRDITWQTILRRPELSSFPRIGIAVEGSPVTLHRVEVDRDLIYVMRDGGPGTGAISKTDGRLRGSPVELGVDQFFCLGDNSPNSEDSRAWNEIDPRIVERGILDRDDVGIVPRELMMGRAFFVYWPSPFSWRRETPSLFINFGDMRFIH